MNHLNHSLFIGSVEVLFCSHPNKLINFFAMFFVEIVLPRLPIWQPQLKNHAAEMLGYKLPSFFFFKCWDTTSSM